MTVTDGATRWRLMVLGSVVRLERGDVRVVPERRTAALLALVALEGPVTRERAAALLWPDREPGRARGNLRQLLFRLRSEADILEGDPLELSPDVLVDAHDEQAIDTAAPRRDAAPPRPAGTGTGGGASDRASDRSFPVPQLEPTGVPSPASDPLESEDFTDMGEIGERIAAGRQRVRTRLRTRLLVRARDEAAAGRPGASMDAADRLLALDPLDEDAARLAMQARLDLGRPVQALALFARTRDALARVLGVGPSEVTIRLAERSASAASAPLARSTDRVGAPAPLAAGGPVARRAEAGGWLAEGAELLASAAEALEPGPERGRMLVQVAWLEHQLGRHDAALAAAEGGIALLEEGGDESARIEGWFVLGSIARVRGDAERAAELWDRALQHAARREGGSQSLALRLNLGMVEDALGRTDAALTHYAAALSLAEAAGDRGAAAVALNNIGHALLTRGDDESAWPLLIRAAGIADEIGDRRLHAYALEGVAACQLARGAPAEARASAAQALAAAREWSEPHLQVEAAVTFAEAEQALGRTDSARDTVRAALRLAHRHGDVPGSMRAAVVLARILGPGSPVAHRTLAVLVRDPRAGEDVLDLAFRALDRWRATGGGRRRAGRREDAEAAERIRNRVLASGDPVSAWDAVVAELVTPG